eukprot:gene11805-2152_t
MGTQEHTHVRVVVRCRPVLQSEKDTHTTQLVKADPETSSVRVYQGSTGDKVFSFDKVCHSNESQDDIFKEVDPLVDHALDGIHATIFAYGQTGSGKTYTMEGFDYLHKQGQVRPLVDRTPRERPGIILRGIESIFDKAQYRMQHNAHIRYKIKCSYFQIYNEKVLDLLNPTGLTARSGKGNPGLRIRWSKQDEFFVENLYVCEVDHPEQLSELTLVELAGSGKLMMMSRHPSSKLIQESIDIHTSLLALGHVLPALTEKTPAGHIPYRESKLTRLLQHSLGGNSMTLMLACISPCDQHGEETTSTLYYAGRARDIKNDPRVNEDPRSALIRALRLERSTSGAHQASCGENPDHAMPPTCGDMALSPLQIENLKAELAQYRQLALEGPAIPAPAIGSAQPGVGSTENEGFLGERLVDSVTMLRELIQVNAQLREQFDDKSRNQTQNDARMQSLNEENEKLREQIEMLESIVSEKDAAKQDGSGSNASPAAVLDEATQRPSALATPPAQFAVGCGSTLFVSGLGAQTESLPSTIVPNVLQRERKALENYNEQYHNPQSASVAQQQQQQHPHMLRQQQMIQQQIQQVQAQLHRQHSTDPQRPAQALHQQLQPVQVQQQMVGPTINQPPSQPSTAPQMGSAPTPLAAQPYGTQPQSALCSDQDEAGKRRMDREVRKKMLEQQHAMLQQRHSVLATTQQATPLQAAQSAAQELQQQQQMISQLKNNQTSLYQPKNVHPHAAPHPYQSDPNASMAGLPLAHPPPPNGHVPMQAALTRAVPTTSTRAGQPNLGALGTYLSNDDILQHFSENQIQLLQQ